MREHDVALSFTGCCGTMSARQDDAWCRGAGLVCHQTVFCIYTHYLPNKTLVELLVLLKEHCEMHVHPDTLCD